MADLAAPELSEASGIVTAVDSELQRLQKDKTAFDKLLTKFLNRRDSCGFRDFYACSPSHVASR